MYINFINIRILEEITVGLFIIKFIYKSSLFVINDLIQRIEFKIISNTSIVRLDLILIVIELCITKNLFHLFSFFILPVIFNSVDNMNGLHIVFCNSNSNVDRKST